MKKDKLNKKKQQRKRSISINWNTSKVASQNNMNDPENDYNHITKNGEKEEDQEVEKTDPQKINHIILKHGKNNHAPQKDKELGRRSISHKAISEKLAFLNAGKSFKARLIDVDDTSEEAAEQLAKAEDIINNKGLNAARKMISNGLTYESLSSVIITQGKPQIEGVGEGASVLPVLNFVSGVPFERLRFSKPVMNAQAVEVVQKHYYHNTWNFTGDDRKDKKAAIPEVISIQDYIAKSAAGTIDNEAFFVPTLESEKSTLQNYISFAFKAGDGVFDGAYPLPKWKANSSINDIQGEFEASCIRVDFLRNGLHIFAIVNVYSKKFNTALENDDESAFEEYADQLEVVQALKRSHNSGKIIVNALGTSEIEKDGKVEVEKIELNFPAKTFEVLSDASRSAILSAWGVAADLFGITKPEKNNLRSQGEFLQVMILKLNEEVSIAQEAIASGVNQIFKYYGLNLVEAYIEPHDSSVYLSVVSEFASGFMFINEIRTKILNLPELAEDELEELIAELQLRSGSSSVVDVASATVSEPDLVDEPEEEVEDEEVEDSEE